MTNFVVRGGVAAIALACVAFANASADELRIKNVKRYDVTNRAGVESLYREVRHAVKVYCGVNVFSRQSLPQRRADDRCVSTMTDAAVEKINSAELSAYHASKKGAVRIADRRR